MVAPQTEKQTDRFTQVSVSCGQGVQALKPPAVTWEQGLTGHL